MPLPVSLDLVAQELDGLLDEMTAYVNRKTGEIVSVTSDDLALVEEEEEDFDEEDLPDWQRESIPKLREIVDGEDWAALPDKFDIHEWEIMRDFANSIDDEALSALLQDAIHGKGAFRMFRSVLEHAGRREEWFAFKDEALKEIAREALEELGVPYK